MFFSIFKRVWGSPPPSEPFMIFTLSFNIKASEKTLAESKCVACSQQEWNLCRRKQLFGFLSCATPRRAIPEVSKGPIKLNYKAHVHHIHPNQVLVEAPNGWILGRNLCDQDLTRIMRLQLEGQLLQKPPRPLDKSYLGDL